jgi:hypothetical protein
MKPPSNPLLSLPDVLLLPLLYCPVMRTLLQLPAQTLWGCTIVPEMTLSVACCFVLCWVMWWTSKLLRMLEMAFRIGIFNVCLLFVWTEDPVGTCSLGVFPLAVVVAWCFAERSKWHGCVDWRVTRFWFLPTCMISNLMGVAQDKRSDESDFMKF